MIFTIVLFITMCTVSFAQSVETFYGIKLEDETSNQSVELRPPSLTTGYTLIFPASVPTLAVGQSRALSVSGGTSGLTWVTVPLITGTTSGVAYFKTNDEISSSTDFLWSEANRSLTLANGSNGNAILSISKSGSPAVNSTAMTLTNSASNAGGTLTKRGLQLSSTGAWTGTNVGLEIAVSGGTLNYAATFTGGRVGVGTSAPLADLEVSGDIAYTEYNYTAALSSSSNNMDFDGLGNRFALLRIGTQTKAFTFTGFSGGVGGKTFHIVNASGFPLTISSQNASSVASNRFITPGNDVIVIPSQSTVTFHYSSIDSRWFVGAVSPLNFVGYPLTELNISTGTVLPTATASYIKVTNNTSNKDVTLEDGVSVGQVLIIQNNSGSLYHIKLTGANIETSASDSTLQPGQALFMVWDGAIWQTVSAKS